MEMVTKTLLSLEYVGLNFHLRPMNFSKLTSAFIRACMTTTKINVFVEAANRNQFIYCIFENPPSLTTLTLRATLFQLLSSWLSPFMNTCSFSMRDKLHSCWWWLLLTLSTACDRKTVSSVISMEYHKSTD